MQQILARNSVKWGHGLCWEGMDHPEHPRAFNLLVSTQTTRQKHHGVLICLVPKQCHDNPTRSAAKLQYFLSLWTHSLGNLPSGAHGTLSWDHSMPTRSLTECRRGAKENITLNVWLDLMTWLLACWLHLNISVYKERKCIFVPNGKRKAIIRCHLCQSSLLSVMEAGHLAESEEVTWSESHSVVSDSLRPRGLYSPWNSPGQNTGVGSLSLPGDLLYPGIEPTFPALQADSLPAEPQGKPKNSGVGSLSLLQRIFPIQESNRGLLHCRWTLCIAEILCIAGRVSCTAGGVSCIAEREHNFKWCISLRTSSEGSIL